MPQHAKGSRTVDRKRTSGALAREANSSQRTVLYWTHKGLLPHERDSSGRHLYGEPAVEIAKRLQAQVEARRR